MNRRINSLKISAKAAGEAICFPDSNGAVAIARPDLAEISSRKGADSFPALMPLGQFLFEYLYRCGVRHSFGIPGENTSRLESEPYTNPTQTPQSALHFANLY